MIKVNGVMEIAFCMYVYKIRHDIFTHITRHSKYGHGTGTGTVCLYYYIVGWLVQIAYLMCRCRLMMISKR